MSSIFSKIVNNEIPSFKVLEDENYLAFLDAFPLSYGHVLVIPKKETDYIFDLDSDKYLGLWNFSQKVAKAMDKVIVC
ncbi:MAG: HIT domain-containing protein, partial [Flavobacteriales bacterium]|nr:HIT domain-containing protein [Flavobacteriales bacterium]